MFSLEQKLEVIIGEFDTIDPRIPTIEIDRRLRVLREAILFLAREVQPK